MTRSGILLVSQIYRIDSKIGCKYLMVLLILVARCGIFVALEIPMAWLLVTGCVARYLFYQSALRSCRPTLCAWALLGLDQAVGR